MRCQEKIAYATQAEAEAKRREMVRRKFHGKALRWLRSYRCPQCHKWHVGHDVKAMLAERPAKQPKLPSVGDLRRKLERMARTWERADDYQRRQRAAALGRLIDAERAIEDAQREYDRLQRETLALFFPA